MSFLRPALFTSGSVLVRRLSAFFTLSILASLLSGTAQAASCKTQSQMTKEDRAALSSFARTAIANVQSNNLEQLRANTLPVVASDFSGIAAAAAALQPQIAKATITVEALYGLDASSEPAGSPQTGFYCGAPVVMISFNNLPPGKYALAILHATGVPQPQQISLVLAQNPQNQWMLAGFFPRPLLLAGHTGLWYWQQARQYAQNKMDWDAWLYYQLAAPLLQPVPFLASPNLQKLGQESTSARPATFPGPNPVTLSSPDGPVQVTALNTTTQFGGLDLEVDYAPDPTQLTQLHDPVAARKQAVDVMTAMLTAHPELRSAFHGIWTQAEQNNSTLYALELPMTQISGPGDVSHPDTH